MLDRNGLETAINKYGDAVRRICYLHTQNYHDTEDIFQNVFFKYYRRGKAFTDEEHEKAWIIRVAVNECNDIFRQASRRMTASLETIESLPDKQEDDMREVREAVQRLPGKYRDIVYLFYYEQYTAVEIADILHKNVNTVYTWLSRAREQLKEILRGEEFE